MFTGKPRKRPPSCSSASMSSLSDIALRNRTVLRDGLLSPGEKRPIPYVSSSGSSIALPTKKKNNRKKTQNLRKTKKGKGSISRKPKSDLKDTMVLAPFHALKESFQKKLQLCSKTIDVSSEEDLDKELRSILQENAKNKKRKKCKEDADFCGCFSITGSDHFKGLFKPGKRATNSESSSVILEDVKLNKRRLKRKINPSVCKKINKKRRPRKKNPAIRRKNSEAEQHLHKKNTRNNSIMKKKSRKKSSRVCANGYRTRSTAKKNSKSNDFIEISLDTDFENNSKKIPNPEEIVNSSLVENPNDEEPPCIVLHPYDPRNEKIVSDDSEDELDNIAPDSIPPADGKLIEEKKSQTQNDHPASTNKIAIPTADELDKIEVMEETADVVEPWVIIQEHYNEPSSAEFCPSENEDEQQIFNLFDNQIQEPTEITCGLQESNLPNYVFGQRNDFSRLRESCEYSFGLAGAEKEEQKDVGGLH